MVTTVQYAGETSRRPSGNLWYDCPWLDIEKGIKNGIVFFDDFINFQTVANANATNTVVGNYAVFTDGTSGTAITQQATPGGVISFGTTTDNEEASLTLGGNVGAPFEIGIPGVAGDFPCKLWFECRIGKDDVGDNDALFYVGLAEKGLAAANTLVDDTAATADKDLVGFNCLAADGDVVRAIYNEAGGTNPNVSIATLKTITACDGALGNSGWSKFGFKYDPQAPATERIAWYSDNVRQSTYVTAANIATVTEFPGGTPLTLLAHMKNCSGDTTNVWMDWWRCAMLLDE